jgi:hypothetical protein
MTDQATDEGVLVVIPEPSYAHGASAVPLIGETNSMSHRRCNAGSGSEQTRAAGELLGELTQPN